MDEPAVAFVVEPNVAPEDEVSVTSDLPVPPPPVRLIWSDVTPGTEHELFDAFAHLTAVNDSEQEVSLELSFVADRGTTRSYRGNLGTIVVPGGSEAEVTVDLAAAVPTLLSKYSGQIHVFAEVTASGEGQEDSRRVASSPLFFHESDGEVLAYGEDILRSAHRAGDKDGLLEATDLIVDPTEDSSLVRVVQFEEEPDQDASPIEVSGLATPPAAVSWNAQVNGLAAEIEPSNAYLQVLCVEFELDTVDSGYANSQGTMEDHWTTGNSGIEEPAAGVRVKIGSTTYDAGSTGCVAFYTPAPFVVYDVRVYAYVSNANDTFIRMHDGAADSTSSYPGSTYSLLVEDVVFGSGVTTVVPVGWHGERWTAMAALAFSLDRYSDSLADTEIHVADRGGELPSGCNANMNYFNDITNNEAYIRFFKTVDCGFTNLRNKFVVSHEYGHAYGQQWANKAYVTPASESHAETPAGSCVFSSPSGFGYTTSSKEWSSLSVREGWAHFVAARVWKDAASDGSFRWGSTYDLERWNASNTQGGYLVNECCPGSTSSCASSLDGAGTINDWMRAMWDLHTGGGGCTSMSKVAMVTWFSNTINASGLANDNFFSAAQSSISAFGTSCASWWDSLGCHNGVDRQGALWTGC